MLYALVFGNFCRKGYEQWKMPVCITAFQGSNLHGISTFCFGWIRWLKHWVVFVVGVVKFNGMERYGCSWMPNSFGKLDFKEGPRHVFVFGLSPMILIMVPVAGWIGPCSINGLMSVQVAIGLQDDLIWTPMWRNEFFSMLG